MITETVKLDKLYLSPSNPRRNEAAVPKVAASIRRFGWQQPIVAKRSGEIIAGNTRFKAAQILDLPEVPVVWFEGSDLDAVAFMIADNKTHDLSSWDDDGLKALITELANEDALEGVGFDQDEIDKMIRALDAEAGTANANAPVIQYNIVFDDEDQQDAWFNFLKRLKKDYPDQETIGARVEQFLQDHVFRAGE